MAETIYIYIYLYVFMLYTWGGKCFWMWACFVDKKSKMALFSIQRPFLTTDWQYNCKRKANAYHTPLSKSTDTIFFFDKFKTLACTTLLTLDSDLPTTRFSTKKTQFVFLFFLHSVLYTRFKLCSQYFFSVYTLRSSIVYSSPSNQASS